MPDATDTQPRRWLLDAPAWTRMAVAQRIMALPPVVQREVRQEATRLVVFAPDNSDTIRTIMEANGAREVRYE